MALASYRIPGTASIASFWFRPNIYEAEVGSHGGYKVDASFTLAPYSQITEEVNEVKLTGEIAPGWESDLAASCVH